MSARTSTTRGLRWAFMASTALVSFGPAGQLTASAADFMVNNNADTGAGSLRAAITAANQSVDATNTITFSDNVGTIQLLSNLPLVATSVTVDGKGSTLDGSAAGTPTYRGFIISGIAANGQTAAATTVGIANLNFQNVVAQGGAGANGGGGGLGAGGAVFVGPAANVTLTNVGFTNTRAIGGAGAAQSGQEVSGGGGGLTGNAGASPGIQAVGGSGGGGILFDGGNVSSGFLGGNSGGGGGGITSAGGNQIVNPNGAGQGGAGGAGLGGLGGGGGGANNGNGGGAGGGTGASAGNGGINGGGGNGGFGGGGGGTGGSGINGGSGGFGGGGGGGQGGNGGFGGGGGSEGSVRGGFAGSGGFGGGGGLNVNGGAGGSGFGASAPGSTGGNGAGLGGAIFVTAGGSLTINGAATQTGGSATQGGGGTGFGSGIFYQGGTAAAPATLSFGAGTQTVADVITDLNGAAGNTSTDNGLGGTGGVLALAKTGTGTLTLSAVNTYTGGTTFGAGVINAGGAGALGTVGTLSFTGGTLQYSAANATDYSARFSTAANQLFSIDTNGRNVAFATTLNSTGGSLNKFGAGTLTLTGAPGTALSYGVAAGTLDLGGANRTATALLLTSGTLADGTLTGTGPFDVRAGTVSANLAGAGTLTKTTGGSVTLSGTNTYNGATNVNAGTLLGGAANTFSAVSATAIATGGTLDLGGFAQTINAVALNGGTLRTGGLTGAVTSTGGTVDGLGGAASLTTSSGTTTAIGTNTYTGPTTIAGGTLQAGVANTFSATSAISVATGGRLDLGGLAQTINAVALNGGTLRNGPLTGAVTSTGGTIDSLGGGASVTTTSGLTNAIGQSTYAGATNVNGGTLNLTGSLAATPMTVANDATFAGAATGTTGSGSTAGSVTIQGGGLLSPGDATLGLHSTGTLTIGGDLVLAAGSTAAFDLGAAGVVGGQNNDLVRVGGNLSVDSASNLALTSPGGGRVASGFYEVFDVTGTIGPGRFGTVTNGGTAATGDVTQVVTNGGAAPSQYDILVANGGQLVQFWDGANQTANGSVDGGAGTWNATNTNWTTQDGRFSAPWQSQVGVFGGAAGGIVTIQGNQSFQGLQFATNGYVLTGPGTLTALADSGLNSGNASLTVDANVSATVAAAIGGTAGLTKFGLGNLTLSGIDTYAGPTSVQAGTLTVAAGGSLASAVSNVATFINAGTLNAGLTSTGTATNSGTINGGVAVNGGSFDTTNVVNDGITNAAAVTARGQANGTVINNAGASFTLTGALTGITQLTNNGSVNLGGNSLSVGSLAGTDGGATLGNGGMLTTGSDNSSTAYAGAVTGATALTKVGGGTFVLSGTNTYTGATSVNGGTLQAGLANAFSAGSATSIATGATLDLGGFSQTINAVALNGGTLRNGPLTGAVSSTSGTLDGLGGSASVTTSSGTTVAMGTNTYTGATSVNGGVFEVDGAVTASNITVNAGGTLAGIGKIGDPTINAGGTLSPGNAANPYGTLTIVGPLAFASGSFYNVSISPTEHSRTDVRGATTIAGGTVNVTAAQGTYTPGTRYTILTSTAGVSGAFSGLTTNYAFLAPSLSYDPNDVYLTLGRNAAVFPDVAQTRNQRATAGAAEALGAGNPLYDAIVTQSAGGARQAFDLLSGEAHSSGITAAVQTAFVVQETILDHLRFGDSTGFGGPGLTGSIGQRFAPGTTLPAAYSADLPGRTVISKVPVRSIEPSYAVWGQAFGSFGNTGSDGNAARMTRQIGGFVVGAETGANALGGGLSDWRAGVAAGYSFTSFDVSARGSSGQVESAFGAVYARGPLGPLQMRLGAAYAGNAFDTRRNVTFPGFSQTLTGKEGGRTVQGFGELGYRITTKTGYLEPFVGGAAISIGRDGFTEQGGAAALRVFGRDYDVQSTTAGLQGQAIVSEMFAGAGPLVARGLVGYRHAFGDVVPTTLLAFTGGGQSFLTAGVPVARDAFIASAGLDLQIATNTAIGLAYNGQIGDRAQDHSVRGNLSYRW